VKRCFRDFTQNQRWRGVFREIEELIMAIGDYINQHDDTPNTSFGPPNHPIFWKELSAPAKRRIIVNLHAAPH
jgi:hypothetical protein